MKSRATIKAMPVWLMATVVAFILAGSAAAQDFPLWPHEQQMIDASNVERARYGLQPLIADLKLQTTARQQSWVMRTNGMHHGYTSGWSAENIAAGQNSVPQVISTWMNSSGHRYNLLGQYRRCGMAGYRSAGGTWYWTQQFGN